MSSILKGREDPAFLGGKVIVLTGERTILSHIKTQGGEDGHAKKRFTFLGWVKVACALDPNIPGKSQFFESRKAPKRMKIGSAGRQSISGRSSGC